jgi:predicted nuclease with TOPRIM domain
MKLKLVAAISALAIPALAHAQQGGPQPTVPKPTKADAQKVVQIITNDKVKTQAYCDLTKLEGEVEAADQKKDTKTLEALNKQAEALVDKLGPEYYKLMDGLEQVDPKSSEAKEFMSILSELDKSCTK